MRRITKERLEDNDLIATSMPLTLAKRNHVMLTEQSKRLDKELLDALARVGFKLDFGDGGTGWQFKYLTRGGGYYFNVGCSDLVAAGAIKLVQFTDIDSFVDGWRAHEGRRDDASRPDRAGDRLQAAGASGPPAVRRCRHRAGRPDLGIRRRPGIAQHVHAHRPAGPLVYRRQPGAMPHQLEISGAADQGHRRRLVAARGRAAG